MSIPWFPEGVWPSAMAFPIFQHTLCCLKSEENHHRNWNLMLAIQGGFEVWRMLVLFLWLEPGAEGQWPLSQCHLSPGRAHMVEICCGEGGSHWRILSKWFAFLNCYSGLGNWLLSIDYCSVENWLEDQWMSHSDSGVESEWKWVQCSLPGFPAARTLALGLPCHCFPSWSSGQGKELGSSDLWESVQGSTGPLALPTLTYLQNSAAWPFQCSLHISSDKDSTSSWGCLLPLWLPLVKSLTS